MHKKAFIILGIFWLVVIGGFIGMKEYTLRTGQEILLQTTPVDPRDLFRGDYVILRYGISRINLGSVLNEAKNIKLGDSVYVGLAIEANYAIAKSIYSAAPEGDLYIKGVVNNMNGDELDIEYGIESYFVPEGKGREIERQLGKNIDVRVLISKSGGAVIKTLLIDGQEVSFQ